MTKKRKILVICPFPEGVAAGQRLKYEQYFDYWREKGFEITISNFMDQSMWNVVYSSGNFMPKVIGTVKGYLRRIVNISNLRKFDIVYVFMWVTPIGTSFFERIICHLARKLIYDVEDNIIVESSNNLNPFIKVLKGRNKTKYLIKHANHVITSSPFLN